MPYFADDFYYYAKIAHNIAAGHGSTFDGTTPTNGYHPLFTLALVPFARAGSLAPIMWFQFVLMIAAAIVTFVFARRIYARAGADVLVANALAMFTLLLPFRTFFQGMEVTITIPLAVVLMSEMLTLLETPRIGLAAGAGLLAAAMALSRLDSALFVFLLAAAILLAPSLRRRLGIANVAAFATAFGLPLLLYIAYNRAKFGAWMPVSGMAKQMRSTHVPSSIALHSVVLGVNGKLLALMAVCALLAWFWQRRSLRPEWRAVLLAAALFPFVHVLLLSVLSDWQMWGWYHYSYVPAFVALFSVGIVALRRSQMLRSPSVGYALLAIACVVTLANRWRLDPEMVQIAETAEAMQPFIAAHPGLYAMGDRAGMVAWLSPQPFFQTEGLVEDRAWLNTLRSQGALVSALRARGVRYYVTTVWPGGAHSTGFAEQTSLPHSCILAGEPLQAGPSAPHLRSVICDKPVAIFKIDDAGPPKSALIFDLQQ